MAATLILMDWQQGLDHPTHWGGKRSTPQAEANGRALLEHWRAQGWSVVHVFHDSTSPGSPLHPDARGNAAKAGFEPLVEETVYRKGVNSAFIGTTLEEDLRTVSVTELIIAGLTTNHCVSTSTRMAGNLGFSVRLVGDACGAHPQGRFDAQTVHDVCLANLDGEFCQVVSTAEVIGGGA